MAKLKVPRIRDLLQALEMITNTAPFDISHHPTMAIHCGMIDGLPVSMMLAGKHFDGSTI
jgi:amidase